MQAEFQDLLYPSIFAFSVLIFIGVIVINNNQIQYLKGRVSEISTGNIRLDNKIAIVDREIRKDFTEALEKLEIKIEGTFTKFERSISINLYDNQQIILEEFNKLKNGK